MKYNCVIVDDERPALKLLTAYIKKLPHLELVASCEDAFEAIAALQNNQVDILFLDIHMPEFTGIELLQSLKQKPQVIMTTAYREYAVEGFEMEVTDYLVKPFSFERFLQGVNKATQNLNSEKIPRTNSSSTESLSDISEKKQDTYFFVKTNHKMEKVPLQEILYIESMREYVSIQLKSRRFVVHQTMNAMEEKLPLPDFMRVHRSYIIGLNHIQTIMGNVLNINGKEIPIGGSYRKSFFDQIEML
ncbi:MAG: DNA-binding LytR/AlgR family response regulator [Granulosicoccus sp.]|jgi:DNA-binding LytR/AlgR family response regulator